MSKLVFNLIPGITIVALSLPFFFRTYLEWRKYRADFRESRKQPLDSDVLEYKALIRLVAFGSGFFIGCLLIISYFNA